MEYLKSFAKFLTLDRLKRYSAPAAAVAIGCFVGLLLAEIMLRVAWPGGGNYYIWPPLLETQFKPSVEIVRGVSETAHYRVNAKGVRAEDWGSERGSEYRILAVGGSTTECILLDQNKAWPALLENLLGKTADGRKVWVGNIGHAGDTTRDHVAFMKLALGQYDVDAVVMLIGINDFGLRLNQGDDYDPHFIERDENFNAWMRSSFALAPLSAQKNSLRTIYRGTAIYHSLRWLRELSGRSKRIERDAEAKWISHARERRKRAHFLDTLPSLTTGLDEYRRNIKTIVDEAERRNIKVIFVTQPTIWHEDLPPEAEDLIWWGLGPGEEVLTDEIDEPLLYTVDVLERGMAAYNKALLDTCGELELVCADVAARLPQTTEMYYDDAHFTEAGALRFAQELAAFVKTEEPFGFSASSSSMR